MLSRSGFLTVLAIGFSICLSNAQAQESQNQILDTYKAPWFELEPQGKFIEATPNKRSLLRLVFGNTTKGKMSRANPEECTPLRLEREMGAGGSDPHLSSLAAQNFFSRCEDILSRYSPSRYVALLKLAEGNYPLEGRNYLREMIISLPYKTQVHALLALKDLKRSRPMIIFICGTSCDLSNATTRLFLAQIFDSSPFNALILPSLSGYDFIRDNKGYGLGGFEEGRQAFEVIRLMGGNDSPFRSLISSFHVFGVSLGGNGALFTSVYGSFNNQDLTGPKIKSVIAYCPVVDLKSSLIDLDRNDLTGKHFTGILAETIVENFGLVLGSAQDAPEMIKPGQKQSVPFVEKYIYPRYKELSGVGQFQLEPFNQGILDTPESYWFANNFSNYYRDVTIPTLLWYSKDDFIVNPTHNSIALSKLLEKTPNNDVNVVAVDKGSHCAAQVIYGDDLLSGVVRNYILSQSPEFDFQSGRHTLPLSEISGSSQVNLTSGEQKYFGYEWKVKRNNPKATLTFKVWDPSLKTTNEQRCSIWSPYYAFEGCFKKIEVKVPLVTFFNETSDQDPNEDAKAQELTRWLNNRVHVMTGANQEPIDTKDQPMQLAWASD